jgi:hypothetical protein
MAGEAAFVVGGVVLAVVEVGLLIPVEVWTTTVDALQSGVVSKSMVGIKKINQHNRSCGRRRRRAVGGQD